MVKKLLDNMCAGDWHIKLLLYILMNYGGITKHLHGFGLQENQHP